MSRATQKAKQFRRRVTRLWDSSCTIAHVTGSTFNDTTFEDVDTTTEVYAGACQARPQSLQEREVLFGDRAASVSSYEVEIPADVEVSREDKITFASSPDPLLVGKTLTVRDVPMDDWVVVRKVAAELVS